MAGLGRNPTVIQLAKDLGLPIIGDCRQAILEYAFRRVDRIIDEAPITVDSLDALRWTIADKFGARLEILSDIGDIDRIAAEHDAFPRLKQCLEDEFITKDTEGITIQRSNYRSHELRFIAIADARGPRSARAYFTGWHEVTHLLIHPEQLRFPDFRRTPTENDHKDPLESVVDHVAGKLAFHPTYFRPAVEAGMTAFGGLTFSAVEAAREIAAPSASLFAAACGSIAYAQQPMLFVAAGMSLKASEQRCVRSPQGSFTFAQSQPTEKLRIPHVIPNTEAAGSGLSIRRNMRVPSGSAIARAYESAVDVTIDAIEDQGDWEASDSGPLNPLNIRVQAIRRGGYVYALLSEVPS